MLGERHEQRQPRVQRLGLQLWELRKQQQLLFQRLYIRVARQEFTLLGQQFAKLGMSLGIEVEQTLLLQYRVLARTAFHLDGEIAQHTSAPTLFNRLASADVRQARQFGQGLPSLVHQDSQRQHHYQERQ